MEQSTIKRSSLSDEVFPKCHAVRKSVFFTPSWIREDVEDIERYAVLALCCLDDQGVAPNLANQVDPDLIMTLHDTKTCPHPT